MRDAFTLHHGDCLEVLRTMAPDSIDAVVTDPPYGLAFMGKRWDYDVPSVEIWAECLRVLKPGGHLLAFAGTRTQHRMAVRIEDAGFEIRDMIAWVYGSGFPKSLDVSKAIDRAAGAEREVVGSQRLRGTARIKEQAAFGATSGRSKEAYQDGSEINDTLLLTAPATPEAKRWVGWGTALKPAMEMITVARKPLAGTVAENVLQWGTGAINVDGCRIAAKPGDYEHLGDLTPRPMARNSLAAAEEGALKVTQAPPHVIGRWPANLIHDGSDEVAELFPQTAAGGHPACRNTSGYSGDLEQGKTPHGAIRTDAGSAARFFYTAKASRQDRDPDNRHPTVKPTDLMRYLCRLVTPPGGLVLDPFMGSGSTGKAAMLEGFDFLGIERDADSFATAERRLRRAAASGHQPGLLDLLAPPS